MVALFPIARLNNSASVVAQHTLPDYTIDVGGFHAVLEVVCRHERHREAGDSSGRNSEFSVAHVGGMCWQWVLRIAGPFCLGRLAATRWRGVRFDVCVRVTEI